MDPCGCDDLATMFDEERATRDRDRYRRTGADRTTRLLLDEIRAFGVAGSTILDIGSGIGIIDQELLKAGASHAVLVDASPASLRIARQEARVANLLDRIDFVDGDFVKRSDAIDVADIVTLDRVVCCYPDVDSLVGMSAARARHLYCLVLPRDRWLVRVALRLLNLEFRFRRKGYRTHAHSNQRIDELVATRGLTPRSESGTFFWRVVIYERRSAAA